MTEYQLFYDMRGNVGDYLEDYMTSHPRIAKSFKLTERPNQEVDLIVATDGVITHLIEFKLSDLKSSIYNKSLKDELGRYKIYADKIHCRRIFLIGVIICPEDLENPSDPSAQKSIVTTKDLAILNSLMNTDFPDIRYSTVFTNESAITKAIDVIRKPAKTEFEYVPIVIRDGTIKGFILSMTSLVLGLSPGAAAAVCAIWHMEIDADEVHDALQEYYADGKYRRALATKIVSTAYSTWLNTEV